MQHTSLLGQFCKDCDEYFTPTVKGQTRCADHHQSKQRYRDSARGTPKERGYDAQYQQSRKLVMAYFIAHGYGICELCGNAITENDDIQTDHITPLSLGGTNEPENLRPVHAFCNSARGNR